MRKFALLLVCACVEAPVESQQALQNGAPRIISTTLSAPIVAGAYQLKLYQGYIATVVVDSGTYTYDVHLFPNNMAPTMGVDPAYIDDTIPYYSGTHTYQFLVTPNAAGNFQVAFALQDPVTGNIFDRDGGVATSVVPPQFVSTVIQAPSSGGVYQLYDGASYNVTVTIRAGNLDYPIYLEGSNLNPSLAVSPPYLQAVIPANSGNHAYTFTVSGKALGPFQLAFKLLDQVTYRVILADGGVPLQVNLCTPSLVSTTIPGAQPVNGTYPLTVGKAYDVLVHVTPGPVVCTTAAQWNTQLASSPPASINLHNFRTYPEVISTTTHPNGWDYSFSVTPSDVGPWQIGFMLYDAITGVTFNADGGVHVMGVSAMGGIYGTVTSKSTGLAVPGIGVQLDNNATVTTDSLGHYQFANPGPGPHQVRAVVTMQLYSPTVAINVTAPASGIEVDLELEGFFYTTQVPNIQQYTRYYDYRNGRTLLHVVFLPKSQNTFALADQPVDSSGNLLNGLQAATPLGATVLVNGGYFDLPTRKNVGYAYFQQFKDSEVYPASGKGPVLGISGPANNQLVQIVQKELNYGDGSMDWHVCGSNVLWDDNPRNCVSDVDWALAAYPSLKPAGYSVDPLSGDSQYWARTTVGATAGGDLWIVVADGEGRTSRQGASMDELANFYNQYTTAVTAMNFDGGGSTQLVLKDANGLRVVNTPTSENPDQRDVLVATVNYLWAHE